ncbi:MAG: FecR domain-containing protein [Bacteroidales bacterium]|nr:FecR domain-containing protein [Bacteroidales bacterium]
MATEKKHNNTKNDLSKDALDMIGRSSISWDDDKEQIWAKMEQKMEGSKAARTRVMYSSWLKVAVAAVFVILAGLPLFMYLYTKTLTVPAGQHSSLLLSDKSKVELNAESKLSYKPFWYKFSRTIDFEGEGFFEVQPGKKFVVNSEKGNTVVLGTSFNIFSRKSEYKVTCVTGKVKVTENTNKKEVILQPGQRAELNIEGELELKENINTEQILSWKDNKFIFTSAPVSIVFDEISRQYGVTISTSEEFKNTYTGYFNKGNSVESVLNLVCKPFNLKYTKKSSNEYVITKGN